MKCRDLMNCIVDASEKAASIARICRQDEHLLELLIQEKKGDEKNPRFTRDFKTLADVLVQEVVRYKLCRQFEELSGFIYGEESNQFEGDNELITVEVKETAGETRELLKRVLHDSEACQTLAEVIHQACDEAGCSSVVDADVELNCNLAVWVDPIDSTGEYINGKENKINGLIKSGLPCVTVLIGVFDRDTGNPLLGAINQPFHHIENGTWKGMCYYGISTVSYQTAFPEFSPVLNEKLIAVSSAENEEVIKKIEQNGYKPVELAGAGYKLLKIITGEVHAYLLTKPTTYYWDVCSCHAVLKAIGGGILDLSTLTPLKYKGGSGMTDCCNRGGILAYRDQETRDNLIKFLELGVQ